MDTEQNDPTLSVAGTVVEILERGETRVARIVLAAGAVVEAPAPPGELTLGDRVTVDASLRVARVRGREVEAEAGAPAPYTTTTGPPAGRTRFEDYEHVLRVAGVFLLGVAAFLVWRSFMVPKDFGQYGHFRGGAIADAASGTAKYGGRASCVECHDDVQTVQLKGRHASVGCESCHGALGTHARGETDVAPVRPSSRAVCLTCHAAKRGIPAAFPAIVVKEHSGAGPCTECHAAHAPGPS